ncbi:MAG: hypothetical protein ACM3Z4_00760 [Hyphomicrobiales bacterium]
MSTDQRVDQRRQLVPRRHGDAGLASLELDRPGTVVDGHHEAAGGVDAPPGPHALLLLDLPALVALSGPALDSSDIGGVGQEGLLLRQALDELGPRLATGSWPRAGTAVKVRFFRIGMIYPQG